MAINCTRLMQSMSAPQAWRRRNNGSATLFAAALPSLLSITLVAFDDSAIETG